MAAKDEVINKFNPKSGPDRDEDKIVPEYPFNAAGFDVPPII